MQPIDTRTGAPAGSAVLGGAPVEVVVGWLVTHDDGFQARLGPDRARAEVYVRQHRAARIEPMFVRRAAGPPG